LTSLISKVALLPHQNIHEYLLDPFLPMKEGVTNLCTAFNEVCYFFVLVPHVVNVSFRQIQNNHYIVVVGVMLFVCRLVGLYVVMVMYIQHVLCIMNL